MAKNSINTIKLKDLSLQLVKTWITGIFLQITVLLFCLQLVFYQNLGN
jgi:hypothetical protein